LLAAYLWEYSRFASRPDGWVLSALHSNSTLTFVLRVLSFRMVAHSEGVVMNKIEVSPFLTAGKEFQDAIDNFLNVHRGVHKGSLQYGAYDEPSAGWPWPIWPSEPYGVVGSTPAKSSHAQAGEVKDVLDAKIAAWLAGGRLQRDQPADDITSCWAIIWHCWCASRNCRLDRSVARYQRMDR
jgi:hypothetical protein